MAKEGNQRSDLHPEALVSGALEWWREAGVDLDFRDDAVPWLEEEAGEQPSPPSPSTVVPAPQMAQTPSPAIAQSDNWPQELEAFAGWWLAEPSLDTGGAAPRVPPRGPESPDLMVLVADPEAGDTHSLLSGALGRFLDNMLGAMGVAPDKAYRATVLPRHTPLADWDAIARSGLSGVVLHHIGLVAPKRLLVLGSNILPLLGHDPAQSPASLQKIDHQQGTVPVMAGWDLAALLARSKARSAFWHRWLDWTDQGL